MTDCDFSMIGLEMATSRDDQSALVTNKKLKNVQYVYSADTTKRDQQDGFSNQPSKTRANLVCTGSSLQLSSQTQQLIARFLIHPLNRPPPLL